jgi:hypothetical protein
MVPVEEEEVPVVVEPPKGSNLHHLPIVFALLPAAAGLVLGGGEKWTDVMLLGLVGVYLNWLVKCNITCKEDVDCSSVGMVSCFEDVEVAFGFTAVTRAVLHAKS